MKISKIIVPKGEKPETCLKCWLNEAAQCIILRQPTYYGRVCDDCPIVEEQEESPNCTCSDEETTGWTTVKCCNICGKPIKGELWQSGEIYRRASDCANVTGCDAWEKDACKQNTCSDFKLKEVKK